MEGFMEISDVTNLALLEQYIKERSYLSREEDFILQRLSLILQERELFFLIKNIEYSLNLDQLLNRYQQVIDGKYSKHQIPRVIHYQDGKVWALVQKRVGKWVYLLGELGDYQVLRMPFDDFYKEGQDFLVLYDDSFVKIIVFLLKIQKVRREGLTIFMEENGYYVDSFNQLVPYDSPYLYQYQLLPIQEEKCSSFERQAYYHNQEQILQRKLNGKYFKR